MGLAEIITIYALLISAFGYVFYFHNKEMSWDGISTNDVVESKFSGVPALTLCILRALFAAVIWSSTTYLCIGKARFIFIVAFSRNQIQLPMSDRTGLTISVILRNNSKKTIHLHGLERVTMFTVWSWIMQGLFFTGACLSYFGIGSTPFVMVVQILYEISFPVAFIVSLIVSFVLIPAAKKFTGSAENFYRTLPLLMHNANVVFMTVEMILNRIPLNYWHLPFILLYGMLYSIFAWYWHYLRGYFYYFFIDYGRPGAIYWYVGLMSGISAFFILSVIISKAIIESQNSVIPYVVKCIRI